MNAWPIRYRQVHLDFHTSPDCPDVGVDFDGDTFARTLQEAHVDAINIFAKCHHGYSYYPTKVGTVHPGLKIDLLGGQIEALPLLFASLPVCLLPFCWRLPTSGKAYPAL